MKNKNGFTLIEIAISVTLLSVVMVFMIRFLSVIRKDEDGINTKTNMLINKTLVSKLINEDIRKNEGINNVTCTDNTCTLTLTNEETRTLTLSEDKKKITYTDTTDNQILMSRKIEEDYTYNLELTNNDNLKLLKLKVPSHEEYNIEIVYYKSDEN